MYPRTNFEMTEADLEKLMDAFKPVPMIMLQCGPGRSQQDRANDAWAELGGRLGFDYMTVQPIDGKGNRFFTAVPSENETQRKERVQREAEAKRQVDIQALETEIAERQSRLALLNATSVRAGGAE